MSNIFKRGAMRALSLASSICIAASMMASSFQMKVYADAVPIVTIGADVSPRDRETIYQFFGVVPGQAMEITVNNQQERAYFEGKIPDDVIGNKTLSCSYTMPTTSGGIIVKTANLKWVSDGMLANALLTCGIANCQVIATAPFPVSGTGALTGIMVAYEQSSGQPLEEEKKQLATEELVVTGDIVDEIVAEKEAEIVSDPENPTSQESTLLDDYKDTTQEQILALLNDIKTEIINGNMSEEKIKEIVDNRMNEYKIQLTEDTYNRLVSYLTALSQQDYTASITKSLGELNDRIQNGFNIYVTEITNNIDFKTDEGSIKQFFLNILNCIKYILGIGELTEVNSEISVPTGIFENVNTDIFKFDTPTEEPDNLVTDTNTDSSVDTNSNTETPVMGTTVEEPSVSKVFDDPSVNEPSVEQPQVEQPQVEQPAVEQPAETPQVEQPSQDDGAKPGSLDDVLSGN